jgi:hypothetical protein
LGTTRADPAWESLEDAAPMAVSMAVRALAGVMHAAARPRMITLLKALMPALVKWEGYWRDAEFG